MYMYMQETNAEWLTIFKDEDKNNPVLLNQS